MTTTETAKTVPEVAIRKGFHRMTAYDMACECRAMLDACPTCGFEGLEPGKSYCCKPSYGTPSLVVIGEVTPKRTQAVASVNNGEPRRIYKGNYHGATFVELNDDLRGLILAKSDAATLTTAARRHGMRTLREDGWMKVSQGVTSADEVLRVTQEF